MKLELSNEQLSIILFFTGIGIIASSITLYCRS